MTYAYRGEIAGRPLVTSCKILVTSTKFSVALATRKAQIWTLKIYLILLTRTMLVFPAKMLEIYL